MVREIGQVEVYRRNGNRSRNCSTQKGQQNINFYVTKKLDKMKRFGGQWQIRSADWRVLASEEKLQERAEQFIILAKV